MTRCFVKGWVKKSATVALLLATLLSPHLVFAQADMFGNLAADPALGGMPARAAASLGTSGLLPDPALIGAGGSVIPNVGAAAVAPLRQGVETTTRSLSNSVSNTARAVTTGLTRQIGNSVANNVGRVVQGTISQATNQAGRAVFNAVGTGGFNPGAINPILNPAFNPMASLMQGMGQFPFGGINLGQMLTGSLMNMGSQIGGQLAGQLGSALGLGQMGSQISGMLGSVFGAGLGAQLGGMLGNLGGLGNMGLPNMGMNFGMPGMNMGIPGMGMPGMGFGSGGSGGCRGPDGFCPFSPQNSMPQFGMPNFMPQFQMNDPFQMALFMLLQQLMQGMMGQQAMPNMGGSMPNFGGSMPNISGIGGAINPSGISSNAISYSEARQMFGDQAEQAGLVGRIPRDIDNYWDSSTLGEFTGTKDQWSTVMMAVASKESTFGSNGISTSNTFTESNGTLSQGIFSMTAGEQGLTSSSVFDAQSNSRAAAITMNNLLQSNNTISGLGRYWGPVSRGEVNMNTVTSAASLGR